MLAKAFVASDGLLQQGREMYACGHMCINAQASSFNISLDRYGHAACACSAYTYAFICIHPVYMRTKGSESSIENMHG